VHPRQNPGYAYRPMLYIPSTDTKYLCLWKPCMFANTAWWRLCNDVF